MKSIKSTTTEAIFSNPAFVGAVILVGGSAASTVTLNDSTDGTGTDRLVLKVAANDSKPIFFGESGIKFDTGVYSTIAGTSAAVYVYIR